MLYRLTHWVSKQFGLQYVYTIGFWSFCGCYPVAHTEALVGKIPYLHCPHPSSAPPPPRRPSSGSPRRSGRSKRPPQRERSSSAMISSLSCHLSNIRWCVCLCYRWYMALKQQDWTLHYCTRLSRIQLHTQKCISFIELGQNTHLPHYSFWLSDSKRLLPWSKVHHSFDVILVQNL